MRAHTHTHKVILKSVNLAVRTVLLKGRKRRFGEWIEKGWMPETNTAVKSLCESNEDDKDDVWCIQVSPSRKEGPTNAEMIVFKFLKAMMFVFNGIIFVAGFVSLGIGIWVKVDSGSIFSFLGTIEGAPPELSQLLNAGYLLITTGLLLLVIGFLGCVGATKESLFMLLLFFIIVLVVFIAELSAAVVILVFRSFANDMLAKFGTAAVLNIKKDYGKNADSTGLWDTTMTTLKCCGYYNSSDFVNSPYYVDNQNHYPAQCCKVTVSSCDQTAAQSPPKISGCFPKIKGLIEDNLMIIVSVALGIAVLEICAMVVSMVLFRRIKSGEY